MDFFFGLFFPFKMTIIITLSQRTRRLRHVRQLCDSRGRRIFGMVSQCAELLHSMVRSISTLTNPSPTIAVLLLVVMITVHVVHIWLVQERAGGLWRWRHDRIQKADRHRPVEPEGFGSSDGVHIPKHPAKVRGTGLYTLILSHSYVL